jgi:uncharacterized protein (TIGR02001 family)
VHVVRSLKWRGRAAACAAALLLSHGAQAQWSGSASAESDYRFRGVSLSGSKPSVRLSANLDTRAGWYAGASAIQSEVSEGGRYGQVAAYAGYAMPIGGGSGLDFGGTYSHFAGNRQYDFAEAYAGLLSRRWSLRVNYSPDYFGRHVQTAYLDASGHVPLGDVVRLFGHLGLLAPLERVQPDVGEGNRARADVRVGIGWAPGDVDLQLAWTSVSRGGPFPAAYAQRRSALLFSASYSF